MRRRAQVAVVVALFATGCSDQSPRVGGLSTRPGEPLGARATTGLVDPNRVLLDSLTSRARNLYTRGEYDSARVSYEAALPVAAALGDSTVVAQTLTSLGLAAFRLNNFAEARRIGAQALAMKQRLGLTNDLFRSYNALGLLAEAEGALELAVTMYDSAYAVAHALNDSSGIAKSLANRAIVDWALGNVDAARVGDITARDIARALGDSITEWSAVVGLASVDVRVGDPLGAIAAVAEVRGRYPGFELAVNKENAYGQLGTAYDHLGETQRAIAALDSAVRIAHAAGLSLQEAEDLKLLAEVYEEAGDHWRALGLLDEAYKIDSTIDSPAQMADVLVRRATTLGAIGDATRARETVARALAIHRHLRARFDVVSDLLAGAELAARAGDFKTADGQLRDAQALVDSLGVPVARRAVAISTARVANQAGDDRRVLFALTSAGLGRLGNNTTGDWEVHALMARAHRRLGHSGEAILHGRRAVDQVEQMRRALGASELRTALVADKADVYADLVLSLIGANRPGDALTVADRSRSRALLDHLAAARLRESDTAATSALIAERTRVLSRIDSLIRQRSKTSRGLPRERAAAATAEPQFSAALAALQREYEELLVRNPGTPPPNALLGFERTDVDAVRAALREDEAVLEFFATPDRTFAFVVTRTGIGVVSTAVSYDALVDRVRLARDLAAYVGAPNSATERSRDAVFRALYSELISPAIASGRLLGKKRLVIVPHGALTYLPFAALKSPSGRSLIEDVSLLYVPVAAALPVLRASGTSSVLPSRVVALAPDPSLANSAGEARTASAAEPGSIALIGGSATERALRDALEEGAIVHLASHGVMESDSPMFSRVVVAPGRDMPRDDGRLEVHELLTFRVRSPLVFLSGCETGAGVSWSSRYARTGDHATLEQAFLYAGAKTVIATRWRVADRGAAALAERFYAHVPTHDAVEALAMAQRDMIRSAEFSDVRHWAAYAVSGSGELRLQGSSPLAEREDVRRRR